MSIDRRRFLKRSGAGVIVAGAALLGVNDFVKAFGAENPSGYQAAEETQTQIELPNLDYDIPRLSRIPDMTNKHSDKDWLDSGARKYEYKLVEDGKTIYHALLYLGHMYLPCENELYEFIYANELGNRKPICGHSLQTFTRFERSDEQLLMKTDRLVGVYFGGDNCDGWKKGDPIDICSFRGNGAKWSKPELCWINNGTAFLETSDAEENEDKTTPNAGFKLRLPLLDKNYSVNLATLYDQERRTLALRQHHTLALNSKCGFYNYSVIPQLKDSTVIDNSPLLWTYGALRNLSIGVPDLVTATVTVTEEKPVTSYVTNEKTVTNTKTETVTTTAQGSQPLSDPVGIAAGILSGAGGAVGAIKIIDILTKPKKPTTITSTTETKGDSE